ncbi:MAG: hypothetical protein ACTHNB_06645 [Gaiellaceae bacterium]
MSEPWLPSGASLDDFVTRIHAQIASFAEEHGLARAKVEVELRDGAVHILDTISAEPGYGFVTLCPHREDDDSEELIVPLSTVTQIRISPAEKEPQFGFTLPDEPPFGS